MSADAVRSETARISIDGRDVEYRVRRASAHSRLRIRVGVGGIEILKPGSRESEDVAAFVQANGGWILEQLDRVERLRSARRVIQAPAAEILFRGIPTLVAVDAVPRWKGSNRVLWEGDKLVIARGSAATATPAQTLENWLRQQARTLIVPLVGTFANKLDVAPGRLYIMDQRTKWGNCSALRNLSFNWRIVMAPHDVLRYLVAHESLHLAVPDHSRKFWLTLQSVCPESERARQWLVGNSHRLQVDLDDLIQSVASG